MKLDICEIFFSLQGESTFAGLPCTFVRLAGCNLACSWCDTAYAKTEKISMELEEILQKVAAFDCSLVEITGGEPLLQEATPHLINRLISQGYQVLLETNGSLPIAGINPRCNRIVDVKCPSSGESHNNYLANLDELTEQDQVKFVIADNGDYLFAKNLILGSRLAGFSREKILLSPVFGTMEPVELADLILKDNLGARLSLQLHKLIWHPEKRGV